MWQMEYDFQIFKLSVLDDVIVVYCSPGQFQENRNRLGLFAILQT